jgi:hypothetical protein
MGRLQTVRRPAVPLTREILAELLLFLDPAATPPVPKRTLQTLRRKVATR